MGNARIVSPTFSTLYGLQLASSNLRNLAPRPKPEEVVRSIATTLDGLNLADKPAFALLSPSPEAAERLLKAASTKRLGLEPNPSILLTE